MIIKIQEFIKNFLLTVESVIKLIFMSKIISNRLKVNTANPCLILGTGPSLTGSIKDNPDFFTGKDLLTVNYFSSSELFEKLQEQTTDNPVQLDIKTMESTKEIQLPF